jgi:hypothetical protein
MTSKQIIVSGRELTEVVGKGWEWPVSVTWTDGFSCRTVEGSDLEYCREALESLTHGRLESE